MASPAPFALEPALRARLRDLRLVAPRASPGRGLGQHPSPSRGAGLEFSEYRAYAPGDDPRRVDWKLHARTDRYYVREAERDSPLTAWLLLDATASMRQADLARPAWSRLDAARELAACVIELALRQGDRFALLALGGEAPLAVPPGSGTRQRDRCLVALAGLRAAGGWPADAAQDSRLERIRAGALVLFLSDFFDPAAVTLAERLAAAGREVACLQLLAADERDFPFQGSQRLVDPETGEERAVEAGRARAGYLERFAAARGALAARLAAHGIPLATHWLDQWPDLALRALFGGGTAAPAEARRWA